MLSAQVLSGEKNCSRANQRRTVGERAKARFSSQTSIETSYVL